MQRAFSKTDLISLVLASSSPSSKYTVAKTRQELHRANLTQAWLSAPSGQRLQKRRDIVASSLRFRYIMAFFQRLSVAVAFLTWLSCLSVVVHHRASMMQQQFAKRSVDLRSEEDESTIL